MIILLSACFRGWLSDQTRYQATEYIVDSPRIVAIRSNPPMPISGKPVFIDALLLAPVGTQVGKWTVSACGLGHTDSTNIWDITCFEDPTEVTFLSESLSLPMNFAAPVLPLIENCEEGDIEDSGREKFNIACFHSIPILVETTVDETPIYAASFSNWYPEAPEENNDAINDLPVRFHVPSTANSGDVIDIEIEVHGDLRLSRFNWYVDAGILINTGITITTEYLSPNNGRPNGISTSSNQLVLPEDYKGPLRIWVVVSNEYGWGEANMMWREAVVEVK